MVTDLETSLEGFVCFVAYVISVKIDINTSYFLKYVIDYSYSQ